MGYRYGYGHSVGSEHSHEAGWSDGQRLGCTGHGRKDVAAQCQAIRRTTLLLSHPGCIVHTVCASTSTNASGIGLDQLVQLLLLLLLLFFYGKVSIVSCITTCSTSSSSSSSGSATTSTSTGIITSG